MNSEELPDYKKKFLLEMDYLRAQQQREQQQRQQQQAQQAQMRQTQPKPELYAFLNLQKPKSDIINSKHIPVFLTGVESSIERNYIPQHLQRQQFRAQQAGQSGSRQEEAQHSADPHLRVLQCTAQQDCVQESKIHSLLIFCLLHLYSILYFY